jgi:protein-disulfide isomerase
MRIASRSTIASALLAVLATLGACSERDDTPASHAPVGGDTVASAGASGARPTSPAPSRPASPRRATESAGRATRPHLPRHVALGDVDLTGIGHDRGSLNAPVVIIDFSDFGCPYCGRFTRETYPIIEREYVRTGKVFFKYVPFVVGMFPHSAEATRAVECVADQGRFWPMADHVYEAQSYWKRSGDPRALLMGIAGVVGADTAAVSQCYRDGRTDRRTARANDVAETIGVRVTPSFVVNERPIQGALPLAEFRKVIDAAILAASTQR